MRNRCETAPIEDGHKRLANSTLSREVVHPRPQIVTAVTVTAWPPHQRCRISGISRGEVVRSKPGAAAGPRDDRRSALYSSMVTEVSVSTDRSWRVRSPRPRASTSARASLLSCPSRVRMVASARTSMGISKSRRLPGGALVKRRKRSIACDLRQRNTSPAPRIAGALSQFSWVIGTSGPLGVVLRRLADAPKSTLERSSL